jgi:hypothetical protein
LAVVVVVLVVVVVVLPVVVVLGMPVGLDDGIASVRVVGVPGTATQYHESSFTPLQSVLTVGFHFTKSAPEKRPNIATIKSQSSPPVA